MLREEGGGGFCMIEYGNLSFRSKGSTGMTITQKRERIGGCQFALFLLLVGNLCFYTLHTMVAYVVLCGVGIAIAFWVALCDAKKEGDYYISRCDAWLTCIYVLFLTYGILFLRSGTFNADMYIVTYVSNLALALLLKKLFNSQCPGKAIGDPVAAAAFCCVVYALVVYAGGAVEVHEGRLGGGLSGNVNTVGVSLGILSIFLIYGFATTKRRYFAFCFLLALAFALMTGSKKVLVFVACDAAFLILSGKRMAGRLLVAALLAICLGAAIMFVPALYETMGSRLVEMIGQVMGDVNLYSHSTESRMGMIVEGFQFFFDNPILGGGEKYFGLMTSWGYEYSHCNVVELLSNYGLVGFAVFYLPLVKNFCVLLKRFYSDRLNCSFGFALLGAAFVTHWMMVMYSDICVMYLPLIMSFVLVERWNENGVAVKKGSNFSEAGAMP